MDWGRARTAESVGARRGIRGRLTTAARHARSPMKSARSDGSSVSVGACASSESPGSTAVLLRKKSFPPGEWDPAISEIREKGKRKKQREGSGLPGRGKSEDGPPLRTLDPRAREFFFLFSFSSFSFLFPSIFEFYFFRLNLFHIFEYKYKNFIMRCPFLLFE